MAPLRPGAKTVIWNLLGSSNIQGEVYTPTKHCSEIGSKTYHARVRFFHARVAAPELSDSKKEPSHHTTIGSSILSSVSTLHLMWIPKSRTTSQAALRPRTSQGLSRNEAALRPRTSNPLKLGPLQTAIGISLPVLARHSPPAHVAFWVLVPRFPPPLWRDLAVPLPLRL